MVEQQGGGKPAQGDKRPLFPYFSKKAFHSVWNSISEFASAKIPGFGYFTKEARKTGAMQEEEVIQRYRFMFDIVKNKLAKLHDIEEKWARYEGEFAGCVPGGETKGTVIGLYKNLGLYTNIDIARVEAQAFQFGTVKVREKVIESTKELHKKDPTIQEITALQLVPGNIPIVWENFGSIRSHRENITAIGYVTINSIEPLVTQFGERVRNTQEILNVPMPPRNALNQLLTALSTSLKEIKKLEEDHFKYLDKTVMPKLEIVEGKRKEVLSLSSHVQYRETRFMHTYKIIKPFVLVKAGTNRVIETKDGEEVEVEKDITKPMYFNPDKNPRTEELEKVKKEIGKIDETGLQNGIRRFEKAEGILSKMIEIVTKKVENRFLAIANYYAHKALKDSKIQLLLDYSAETIPAKKAILRDKLEQTAESLAKILKSYMEFLAYSYEDYLDTPKNRSIHQITSHLRDLKKDDKDVESFLASLDMKISRLRDISFKQFNTEKENIVTTSLKQLKEIKVDTDGIPEFKMLLEKICYYSNFSISFYY